ncbi:MAG TPA: bifunctional homocysteine S-methyltransferase/methylenetetrahydrofolate reductase [Polyangiales bacterium]|nr:bifunctional homocysteine S-methyltransferase/methylenetetrahydrofolate reductase [Polyangiales bacterium]
MTTATPFLERLSRGAVVLDGAMSTALYERGLLYSNSFDEASLSRPELVRAVHDSHVRAGADLICTNTFGANRMRLRPHGLEEKLEQINNASVELARAASGGRTQVAGDVGPTGLLLKAVSDADRSMIEEVFREQAQVLVEAGVDAILLETFRQPEELRLALSGVRAAVGKLPVIALVSFDAFGTMADGSGPEQMAEKLAGWGADAIGVNCADGPAGVYEMATRMLKPGLPVIAKPNAGLPQRVDGRLAYMATPEYFQLYARRLYKAGIKAVGGCCGTTAEHVKKIAAAARMVGGGSDPGGGMRDDEHDRHAHEVGIAPVPTAEKGFIGANLGKKFLISVEVNPPPGLSLGKAIEGAKLLKAGGVDIINVADGARASARMGNLALCMRIQEQVGMPALMHVVTRDRNLLGLLAHLLAAHEVDVRNLVVITGDPPKMGDLPDATPVYDLDSIGLLRLISGLNRGLDPGGKPLGAATAFLCATGVEPAAKDYPRELERLKSKIDAGAEFVMTQPVYDETLLDRLLADLAPLGVPVLVGLLPLASHRNAEFLHNEVPGMSIPDAIRERMRKAGSGDAGRNEGVQIARETLERVKSRVAGAYIMPPFGRYQLALDVIQGIVR